MSEVDRDELRRLLAEATPGPWEFGDRQFRARVHPKMFGEGRCAYCGNPDRPLVHTGQGKHPWHVHEGGCPWWDHGVYAYRASGSLIVVNDTDEYGYMADENARLIVAAVNALPGLLDALEKAEAHRDSLAAALIEVQREKLAVEARLDHIGAAHKACHEQREESWAAIDRVRGLHIPGDEWCGFHESSWCECADAYCEECDASWPCPTIQALDGK